MFLFFQRRSGNRRRFAGDTGKGGQSDRIHLPLAGTRPRGKDEKRRIRSWKPICFPMKRSWQSTTCWWISGRNDLGRFCRFGTVEVEKYLSVEKFSRHAHWDRPCGALRSDKTALDALQSVLPAGTLSGAPKLRACQIINDGKQQARHLRRCHWLSGFCGKYGYVYRDPAGILQKWKSIRPVGSRNCGGQFSTEGISGECINKAKAVVLALQEAQKLGKKGNGHDFTDR